MTTSALAPASTQLCLLHTRPRFDIESNAHARNVYGAVAQEFVCAVLGLHPIPINGNYETCFDAERNGNHFEIKSVGNGHKIVLYDFRMAKEAKHPGLQYAIFIHRIRAARTFDQLLGQLIERPPLILVVPAPKVHMLALAEPLRKLVKENAEEPEDPDTRNGYRRVGYRDGYRNLPVSPLLADSRFIAMSAVELYETRFEVAIHT